MEKLTIIHNSMKRISLSIIFIYVILFSISAQKSTVVIDLGYRNKTDNAKWGLGAQYKYKLPYNLRVAADFIFYLPKESTTGLDISVNAQYLLNIKKDITLYPIAGIVMSNHSFSAEPYNRHITDLGLETGLGGEFYLSKSSFINAEFKYLFIDKEKPAWYRDYGIFRVGYGFSF